MKPCPRPAISALLLAVATLAAALATACSLSVAPSRRHSFVIGDDAIAGYQLHAPPAHSNGRSAWWLAYVESATADLVITHGTTTGLGDRASVSVNGTEVVDRVDVAPGINPVLGAFVAFESDGEQHLIYVDQELPDQRLTKWLHRPMSDASAPSNAAPEPWEISLLPSQFVPIASSVEAGHAAILGVKIDGDPARAAAMLHIALIADGQRVASPRLYTLAMSARLGVELPEAAPHWRPIVHAIGCGARTSTEFLVAQPDRSWALLSMALGGWEISPSLAIGNDSVVPATAQDTWPLDVACVANEVVTLLARPDHRLRGTDAWELVFAGGGGQQTITLARDVTQVALVPSPPSPDNELELLTGPRQLLEQVRVLFTERALDEVTPPRFQLVMIEPRRDADGVAFSRRLLWSGIDRVVDFDPVVAGSQLIVAFRTSATSAPAAGAEVARTPLRLLSAPLSVESAR